MCFGGRTVKDVLVLPQQLCVYHKRDTIWKRGRPLIHEAFLYNGSKYIMKRGYHNTIEQFVLV